jgi:hypothetical protein
LAKSLLLIFCPGIFCRENHPLSTFVRTLGGPSG